MDETRPASGSGTAVRAAAAPAPQTDDLIARIVALPQDWHGAGTVNASTLRALARHIVSVGPIEHTIETGSGRSTLLFSHLSPDHRVFAVDDGNSIGAVRASDLFNPDSVTFVEGPTQVTMATYDFPDAVQVALIDGPHGYPFPDLEYFHLYPRLCTGGILFVDDIRIPSIERMFDVIAADDMFDLLEVVDANLAVFRRTAAPLVDPHGDGWWLQGYNKAHYEQIRRASLRERLVDGAAALVPANLKDKVPAGIKSWFWKQRS